MPISVRKQGAHLIKSDYNIDNDSSKQANAATPFSQKASIAATKAATSTTTTTVAKKNSNTVEILASKKTTLHTGRSDQNSVSISGHNSRGGAPLVLKPSE